MSHSTRHDLSAEHTQSVWKMLIIQCRNRIFKRLPLALRAFNNKRKALDLRVTSSCETLIIRYDCCMLTSSWVHRTDKLYDRASYCFRKPTFDRYQQYLISHLRHLSRPFVFGFRQFHFAPRRNQLT